MDGYKIGQELNSNDLPAIRIFFCSMNYLFQKSRQSFHLEMSEKLCTIAPFENDGCNIEKPIII